MQDINAPVRDPRFMDAQGQFWFWDVTFTKQFGPYANPTIAGQKLNEYTQWVNSQSQAAVVEQQAQPVDSVVAQAVAEFIRLRDERDALSAKHKDEAALLEEQLAAGEAFLTEKLKEMGAESFKVPAGTVFTSTQARSAIPDKAAFSAWVLQTGEIDLLQSRLSNTNLEKWIETHDGALPPGVTFSRERVVRVRRA
jgi:PHD/YefM family antitoxin component YafN of YafNO toxin-antitoxin module